MRKPKTVLFLTSILLIVILSIVFIAQSATAPSTNNQSCSPSFHQFAYDGPSSPGVTNNVMLPDSSWQVKLLSANLPDMGHPYSLYRTEMSRVVDGNLEIWMSLSDGKFYFYLPQFVDGREGIGIYSPDSQNFEIVSHFVEDTDLYVVNLYVDSNGVVWGEVHYDSLTDYPDVVSFPTLSKFNENSRRFEFAEGVLEVPLFEGQDYFNSDRIVLDNHDIFWIFAEDGEIYRYDPVSQTSIRYGNGLGGQVVSTSLSPDGDIYFALNEWQPDLRLPPSAQYRFSPESEAIALVEVPDANWPYYSGLLVDHTGQLWLGAIGFRDLNSDWNLIYPPYLGTYSDHLGQYMWASPEVMFESSDGRLWYSKYLDSSLQAEGTAWFDPATNEGCLVTNVPTRVIEDSEQRLWIVVDGVLYSSSINQ